jgi:hypothetical protein
MRPEEYVHALPDGAEYKRRSSLKLQFQRTSILLPGCAKIPRHNRSYLARRSRVCNREVVFRRPRGHVPGRVHRLRLEGVLAPEQVAVSARGSARGPTGRSATALQEPALEAHHARAPGPVVARESCLQALRKLGG